MNYFGTIMELPALRVNKIIPLRFVWIDSIADNSGADKRTDITNPERVFSFKKRAWKQLQISVNKVHDISTNLHNTRIASCLLDTPSVFLATHWTLIWCLVILISVGETLKFDTVTVPVDCSRYASPVDCCGWPLISQEILDAGFDNLDIACFL